MDDCEIIVSKEPVARPAKDGGDGLNARQRRKAKKRAKAFASTPHLEHVARALKNKRLKQSHRWVDYQVRNREIYPGFENEVRWGLKTGMPHLLSDEAQSVLYRLDIERVRTLRAKKEAGLAAEDEEWVDDWFGEANVGTSTTGTGTGNTSFSLAIRTAPAVKKEEERMGMELEEDNGDEGGKSADRGDGFGDPGLMSDVGMDGSGH